MPRECSYFEAKKYIAYRVSIVSCLLQQAECSSTQARPFGLRRLDKAESWLRFSLCHTDTYERDVTLFLVMFSLVVSQDFSKNGKISKHQPALSGFLPYEYTDPKTNEIIGRIGSRNFRNALSHCPSTSSQPPFANAAALQRLDLPKPATSDSCNNFP